MEHVADADDARHALRGRLPQELGARRRLDDPPGFVDHDAVAEAIGLREIVGHEDGRGPPLREHGAQVVAQRLAQRQVERGERLVEKKERRIGRERAAEGHALLLAARELARPPRGQSPPSPSRSSTSRVRSRRAVAADARRP